MAPSGHFDPGQTCDDYKAVEALMLLVLNVWPREKISSNISIQNIQTAISALLGRSHVVILGQKLTISEELYGTKRMDLLGKSSQFLRALLLIVLQDILIRDVERWNNFGGPIPAGGRPIYSSSAVPISRINTEGVVKWRRQIANSACDLDAEGSDELDGEEVEVVKDHFGHQYSASTYHTPSKRFPSRFIHSIPRNFQPTLATIPTSLLPALPSSSHTRPVIIPAVRPSPIQQSRTSSIVTSQQLQ
ncbi:hypothetical protein O181_036821 [Austropuccinia psidii MF-1]|uniref:Uncharacterized protein n=1 Tax=Austropuccinia psidii MF-1 TaxID=1389203 RepID=A0A9Q3DAX2_9BASI|nr:hypothetical protein [Austropuccinia psidii MF-1]